MPVSILVFLDQALKVDLSSVVNAINNVSILVFLDQALKDSWFFKIRILYNCFNPCFPGSSAESVRPGRDQVDGLIVSILVFLDQALKDEERQRLQICVQSFNPCFPGSSAERRGL